MANHKPRRSPRARSVPEQPHPVPVLRGEDLTPERPVAVAIERYPEAAPPGSDVHLAFELGIVLAGRLERNPGREWYTVRAGQAWVSGMLEPHAYRISRGLVSVVFRFSPSLFGQMPHLAGFEPMAVFRSGGRFRAIGSTPKVRQALVTLGRELAAKYADRVLPGPACVDLQRAIEIAHGELVRGRSEADPQSGGVFDAGRVQPAIQLSDQATCRAVSVGEAARACGMSRSTFARHFKRITGLGFARFALRWRLARAAHLLRSTDVPMKDVFGEFGFKHLSHFQRAFRQHYGMSPGHYRKIGTEAGTGSVRTGRRPGRAIGSAGPGSRNRIGNGSRRIVPDHELVNGANEGP